jgi:aminoglycoside phosphotransferase (APT) family kinase protein
LLVLEPLEAYLDGHGLGSGPIRATAIGDGHSNFTFSLRREGSHVVLRRPPRPPVPPSAHDVLREARLLKALEGTAVPTPVVLAACDDEAVIGVPFYLMEWVPGQTVSTEMPPALDLPAERRRIGEQMVEILAALHAVDWAAIGLEGFARPSGYLERQIRRFRELWELNKTRELSAVDEVGAWLEQNLPITSETTVVHGDCRPGNALFAEDRPARVTAMLDWEMATLGDPLADVGFLTATWSQPGDPEGLLFDLSPVTRKEGFMTRQELADQYVERTGRDLGSLRWYQTLAFWKASVFMEGNYKRAVLGESDDPFLKNFADGPEELALRAMRLGPGGKEI